MPDNNQDRINIYLNSKQGGKMPTWKGYVTLNGVVHEIAMWPAKNGKPDTYSGTVKLKEDKSGYPSRDQNTAPAEDGDPFNYDR